MNSRSCAQSDEVRRVERRIVELTRAEHSNEAGEPYNHDPRVCALCDAFADLDSALKGKNG